jgi:hypothetical protein
MPVLSNKNDSDLSREVHTLPHLKKDAGMSPATDSPPEVLLSEDESLASPKKEVKVTDENCDLSFTTSKPTFAVKRKMCSEDIPDIIPVTPTSKTRKFSLSCRRTKRSKMGKCSSSKGGKEGFSLIDSLDKAFNTDAAEHRVVSVNNPELLNTSPCKNTRLNGVESGRKLEGKASNHTLEKAVGQVCTEKCDYSNTSNLRSYANDCMNTQDCTKFDNLLESVKNNNEVTSLGFEHDNCHSTEQGVKAVNSAGCDMEASSFEELVNTNGNVPLSPISGATAVILNGGTNKRDAVLENSVLYNHVASKNKVSDWNVPKYDIKQTSGMVCTSSILEISDYETKRCRDEIDDSVRSNKTASSDILELNCDCDSVGSSNEVLGYDILNGIVNTAERKVEGTCTILPEESVLRLPISKSGSVGLEAKGSEDSVQESDQHPDVLCCRLQASAAEQLTTNSRAASSDDIAHEDHIAWLASDNWDFSVIEEKGTG